MVDAHNAARVQFKSVELGADALLGTLDAGGPALAAALDVGRAAVAAELMGLADEVFDRTVQYLKDRRQFGKQIGEFQALQHRAAHLYSELQITHAAVLKAQQMLDDDIAGAAATVAMAKARAGRTATLAVQEAVQMHGGMGMTDAFEFGFFMKRARVLQELWGDSNFHLDALARRRGY
jgi:alkylation response protein AidB-like acyl-CoA dehydrogenase